ncbi:MAG: hypothetical protein GC160_18335 [Acidobacteria bacterium]|nr:hypothetical protein [Acidobacteriota bacterium]
MLQKILLLGLDEATASAMAAALPADGYTVHVAPVENATEAQRVIEAFRPDVICAPPGSPEARDALRETGSKAPLIAISQKANPREWLAAVQGGAWDYFGGPFEARQVQWILRSATSGSGMPTVLSLTA